MYKDFISTLHQSTKRDYLKRVNDKEYPKYKAAALAKKWGYHYWDGSRKINYGGYRYIPNRWDKVIKRLIKFYNLKENAKILDVGCGKGFFLNDLKNILPEAIIKGVDISSYAINKSLPEIRKNLIVKNCTSLPWKDNFFDLAVSFNTFHNLHNYDLKQSLKEFNRISKNKYFCVESYRNEKEKANLLYWQVTCESFCTPREWKWWMDEVNYNGDHSFIYFS